MKFLPERSPSYHRVIPLTNQGRGRGREGGRGAAPCLWQEPAIVGGEGGREGGRGEDEAHDHVLERVRSRERQNRERSKTPLLLILLSLEKLCCPSQVPPSLPPSLPTPLIDLSPDL